MKRKVVFRRQNDSFIHALFLVMVIMFFIIVFQLGTTLHRLSLSSRFMASSTKMAVSRWRRKFHDTFDQPDPLSYLVGPDYVRFEPHKYVIYRCDTETMAHCGGWADRVRAMFTAYLVANLSGRVFKAEMLMPGCDIHWFMVPNHVNWSLPVSFHKRVTPNATVKMLDMWAQPDFYYNFTYTDWVHHPGMDSDYFYMKGNHDNIDNFRESRFHAKDLQWMQRQDRVAVNRFLFKRLLRPTTSLRNKVIQFLADNVGAGQKLVCAHLRMGQNPTMPFETRDSINPAYLVNVWDFLEEQSKAVFWSNSKIFLMSDSTQTISQALRQSFGDKLFLSPGNIVHIELSNVNDRTKCEGLEKVIFEQLVLMHCDVLLVSDSGISRMAAYVRGSDENLFCFLPHGPVVPCTTMEIKVHLYNSRN